MTMVVFAGPTLRIADAPGLLVAPPARRGDVLRALRRSPWAIGLIDGYFEFAASVWHKEILFALSKGVHVFGAASMGALRASELAAFGMTGIGWIYEAFRDGRLEDDDEVAVQHGPAETGYLALSDALVDIRRTFARACEEGVIAADCADALIGLAKATFYKERRLERVVEAGAAAGLPQDQLQRLRGWLPHRRVDQKRADAEALVATMGELASSRPAPKAVGFPFESTWMWQELVRRVG